MQYGQCTNIDEPCTEVGKTVQLQDWDKMECATCGHELMPVAGKKPLRLPLIVKVLPLVLLATGSLAFGGKKLYDWANMRSESSPAPQGGAGLDAPEDLLAGRLPDGFELDGDLIEVETPGAGFSHAYGISLIPRDAYRVPYAGIEPPADWSRALRDLADLMTVDQRLPVGKTFDVDRASPLDANQIVRAVWRVNLARHGDGWVAQGRDSLEIVGLSNTSESPDWGILTGEEKAAFGRREQEILAAYRARWELVEADIANFEQEAARGVPPACTKDLAPIIREVVRLSTACPRIQEENERNACFIDRDRLNSEIGACETQTKLHEEGLARTRQAVVPYAEKRMATFREELRLGS